MKKGRLSVVLLAALMWSVLSNATPHNHTKAVKKAVPATVAPVSLTPASVPPTTAAQINYVVEQGGTSTIGVMIKNLSTGQILYQSNINQPLVPASNLKVFTATAALEYLTPNFQYKTYIASATPAIVNGVFHGDLYLVFSGDPSLTRQDINDLFAQLKQQGIGRIIGHIYLDDTLFDHDASVPDALAEDASYCFSAPVFADNLDHNCIGITAKPSLRVGAPALVSLIQQPNSMNLINQITTASRKSCNIVATPSANNSYLLTGCISSRAKAQYFSVPAQNMRVYSMGVVQIALKQANISLAGQILFGKKSIHMQVMASHQSDPLPVLLKHMLKESDNLYANSIVKTVGAYYSKRQGTWQTGTSAVMSILTKYNQVDFTSANLVDGAGLSRLNVITPAQMLQVLTTVYQKPAIFAALMQALPIAGVDGTLKSRLTDAAYRNNVHAKTGTMSDVSSLSGYLQNRSKQTIAFAIMINDNSPHPAKYRKIEDTICKILILSK
ncbi:MAG: D-alanyl-D-alanine carboxypeptidase/D-alanyl-D-alanine-endopeptidase [Legionellales bacterium]|nr:D-alanyl-D-alanine carboxypeptidase/D-alanyl-D-alanine-endopeptidase [Legionellales bacterium]